MYINIIKSLGELSAMAPGRGQQSAHVKIFALCFRSHQQLYLYLQFAAGSVSIVIIVTTLDNVAINVSAVSYFSIQYSAETHKQNIILQ